MRSGSHWPSNHLLIQGWQCQNPQHLNKLARTLELSTCKHTKDLFGVTQ